jgi:hypothetical protein
LCRDNHDNVNCQILIGGNHEDGSQCSCSKFHHHTFQGHTFFLPPEIPDKSESELLFSSKFEFLEANQRHLNVCNTFWRPSLSLNQQNYANRRTCYKYLVDFESLWPEENTRIVGYFLLAREIQNQPNIYNMFSDWHNSVDLMIMMVSRRYYTHLNVDLLDTKI